MSIVKSYFIYKSLQKKTDYQKLHSYLDQKLHSYLEKNGCYHKSGIYKFYYIPGGYVMDILLTTFLANISFTTFKSKTTIRKARTENFELN